MAARGALLTEIQALPVVRFRLHMWCPVPSSKELPTTALVTLNQYLFLVIIINEHFVNAWVHEQIFLKWAYIVSPDSWW